MSDNKSSGGIGFTGCLTIAFIVLKLCNVITWSWWWVLSPVWIGVVVAFVLLGIVMILERRNDKMRADSKNDFENTMKGIDTSIKNVSKWRQRLEEMQAKRN